jgi:hypothetical protein
VKNCLGISLVAVVVASLWASTAEAGYCGANRYRCCKPACTSCQTQCCTVMKVQKEVTYEEKSMTVYDTVFEEVPVKRTVDTTKFVDDKEPRIVSMPICQTVQTPCSPSCCEPCAAPKSCAQQTTVPCLQRVPVPVVRDVPAKEELQSTRIVEKKTPRTVICLTAHVKCVEVPVQVCCPMPSCCGCAGK